MSLKMLHTLIIMTLTKFKLKNLLKKNESLSLFHINTYSLNKDFDDLEHLLKRANKRF